jgi:hypothetical protein
MAYGSNPNPIGMKPPAPPSPPLTRHIRAGVLVSEIPCRKCGSSMEYGLLIFRGAKCINPECRG